MTETLAREISGRVRISDPKPPRCSACFTSADVALRFVDFDGVAINRGAFVDPNSMAVLDSIDELHLCEPCVRSAAEMIEYVPGLHQRHLQELRRLNRENDELRAYIAQLEQTIAMRPDGA